MVLLIQWKKAVLAVAAGWSFKVASQNPNNKDK
jgi:hypothetical protein